MACKRTFKLWLTSVSPPELSQHHIICFFAGWHDLGLQKYNVSEKVIQEQQICEELQLHFTLDPSSHFMSGTNRWQNVLLFYSIFAILSSLDRVKTFYK